MLLAAVGRVVVGQEEEAAAVEGMLETLAGLEALEEMRPQEGLEIRVARERHQPLIA